VHRLYHDRMRVFLAGATGVIGRRLLPLLLQAGHQVTGTTRSRDKAEGLLAAGAEAAVVDVFDAAALTQAVQAARPEVVIHQLTDLPDSADPAEIAASDERNMRIRIEGTRNLATAAQAAGARRLVAQSIAFIYAEGRTPYGEDAPLAADNGPRGVTARGVRALEAMTTTTPGIEGIVLRYGRLHGPGTWTATPPEQCPLHVDAAAHAALLAVSRGRPGIYNIAEDDGTVSVAKARSELGFDPDFRLAP
jgi:nucleoside-diphosphate-sugar epimerase